MSLLALLLPAGACAVKLLLRLNDPSLPDVADAIDDFSDLYSRVNDEYARRKLIRQTEDMADEFAKHIADELSGEYRGMADGDVKAATDEAVRAISISMPLTREQRAEIVAASDASSALYTQIRERANVDGWDGEHGETTANFARLILAEICHTSVAAMRRHPDLTVDMLARLMRDTDQLLATMQELRVAVDQIPSRVQQKSLSRQVGSSDEAADEYTLEYLRSIVNQLDQIGLYGLDLEWEVRHYSLTTSYIALRLETQGRESRAVTLDQATARRLLYLRGPAGSGKTTILQWLAVGVARNSLPPEYKRLRGKIPVLVRLRDHIDTPLPRAGSLTDRLASHVMVQRPDGWARAAARQRGFLLLVDGVDEFPESRTGELIEWLRTVSDSLDNPTIVVTGRPSAGSTERAINTAFNRRWMALEIQPMDRPEIRSFVLHWHKSTHRESRSATYGHGAMLVADRLAGSREYRQLASTPLLCAALCALFYVRNGVLPSSRVETYETLIRLLLSERDSQRGVAIDQVLDPQQRRFVLEQLAMFMISNNLSELPFDRAIACIERSLERIQGTFDAEEVMKSLVRRSGIVREPTANTVDYVHRTFLEYLAASAHVESDSVEALGEKADDPNWAEAVVLAGSLANVSQFTALVELLLDKGESKRGITPTWLIRVVAGLLQTRVDRVPGSSDRLERVLESSLPPRDEEHVRAVINGGDQLLPLLVSSIFDGDRIDGSARVRPGIVGAVIRGVGDQGGEDALALLESLPRSLRAEHIDDLLAVWGAFDPSSFASRVLEDLEPAEATGVTLRTSRVFPYLGTLSSRFSWRAEIDFPETSLASDVHGVELDTLSIKHVNALRGREFDDCEFVSSIGSVRQLALEHTTGFAPSRLTRSAETIELLSVSLVEGVFDVRCLSLSPRLNRVGIAGTARAAVEGHVDRALAQGAPFTLVRLAGGLDTSRARFDAVSADLVGTPAGCVSSTIGPHLVRLALERVEDLTLDCLTQAVGLTHLSIVNCRDLSSLRPLLALPDLQDFKLSGLHLVTDQAVIDELERSVPVTEFDTNPDALFGQDQVSPGA